MLKNTQSAKYIYIYTHTSDSSPWFFFKKKTPSMASHCTWSKFKNLQYDLKDTIKAVSNRWSPSNYGSKDHTDPLFHFWSKSTVACTELQPLLSHLHKIVVLIWLLIFQCSVEKSYLQSNLPWSIISYFSLLLASLVTQMVKRREALVAQLF